MENCIFCKIIKGQTDTKIEFENENLVIFKDINPSSKFHYLAVLKKHVESAKCLKAEDEALVNNMENSLREVFKSKGANTEDALFGFHWPPFTSVKHIHMHGIAPASEMGFVARLLFKPGSLWFCTTECVRQWIKKT